MYGCLVAVMPSPKSQTLAVVRPPISAVNPIGRPAITLVKGAAMPTLNRPVRAPTRYSSQPMEGGLAQGSPSMSVPWTYAASPAPRQGELALKCETPDSCGSEEMLPTPLVGSGVVQQ